MSLRWKKWRIHGAGMRTLHSATLLGGKVYIYGGYAPSLRITHADFLVVEKTKNGFKESVLRDVQQPIPHRRNGHTANLVDDQLFVFGGWSGMAVLTDVWIFDFVLKSWILVETRGKAPLLNMHNSEYIEWMKCILCFGGGDGRRFENAVHCLGVRDFVWKRVKPTGHAPGKRSSSSSCLVNTTWFIFGGWFEDELFDDIHLLDLPKDGRKPSWSSPIVSSTPSGRVGAGLAYFHGAILLFGGGTAMEVYNDICLFDIHTQRWREQKIRSGTAMDTKGDVPNGCSGHTVTVMPSGLLLVYGGTRDTHVSGCIHTLESK